MLTIVSCWWGLKNGFENNENVTSLTCTIVPVFTPCEPWVTRWPCVWSSCVCVCMWCVPTSCLIHFFMFVCCVRLLFVFLRKRGWHEACWCRRVHAESLSSRETGFNRGRSRRACKKRAIGINRSEMNMDFKFVKCQQWNFFYIFCPLKTSFIWLSNMYAWINLPGLCKLIFLFMLTYIITCSWNHITLI